MESNIMISQNIVSNDPYTYDDLSRKNRKITPGGPLDLVHIKKHTWAMSPKADGIHLRGVLDLKSPEILPYTPNPPEDCFIVYYEHVKDFTNFVFNIYRKDINHLNVLEKLNWLRKEIGTIEINMSNWNDKSSVNSDAKWWPKPIFAITDVNQALEMMSNEFETLYPNDGWILTDLENNEHFKVKPLYHTTIDLIYKEGKFWDADNHFYDVGNKYNIDPKEGEIWRFYYEYGQWHPKDHRFDSFMPNKKHIVDFAIQRHTTHKFYANMVKKFLNLSSKPFYQSKLLPDLSLEVEEYLKFQTEDSINRVSNYDFTRVKWGSYWLELGCGDGTVIKGAFDKIKPKRYAGLDIDPTAIKKCTEKLRNPKAWFAWCDMNDLPWVEIPWTQYNIKYQADVVLCIFSWQYQKYDRWLEMIEEISYDAKFLIIKILDTSLLKKFFKTSKVKGPYGIQFHFEEDQVSYKFPWKEEEYSERYVTVKSVADQCKNYGWKLVLEEYMKAPENIKSFKPLIESTVWLKFKRSSY